MVHARAFARCSECGHATLLKPGAACLMCGGVAETEPAPHDLFSGWRCDCYHCVSTPC